MQDPPSAGTKAGDLRSALPQASLLFRSPRPTQHLSAMQISPALSSLVAAIWVLLPLAVGTDATPLVRAQTNSVRLPMAKRINATGSVKILAHDQARVRGLRARAAARAGGYRLPNPNGDSGSVPATNQVVDYVVDVSTSCLAAISCGLQSSVR